MPHQSSTRLLVLHALRLKGFASDVVVAEALGTDADTAGVELKGLADEGLVSHREGRLTGWSLTAPGRARHAELVQRELDELGARGVVTAAYRRFLDGNTDLLTVCTAWQLRPSAGAQVMNDHTDPDYDAGVVAELARIHATVRPVTDELAGVLDRFGSYGNRLDRALGRVQAGEIEWFTRPMIDSYHTIWFELHEDLLSTLGIERATEGKT